MKRTLIHALCWGIVAVGGTRLDAQETDYDTCFSYCMGEGNGFEYCRDRCLAVVHSGLGGGGE